MSLDKAIETGKEHRKPYRGSKAIDPSCRNHGECPWCQNNRLYKIKKQIIILDGDFLEIVRLKDRNRKLRM